MKKIITKSITIITMLAIVLTMALPMTANAKANPKISKTKATLNITNKKKNPTVTLRIKNANSKKAVKWSTSNKKVATVKRTGKYTCKVTAKKSGKAKITAKVNGKKYTCKAVVKDSRTKNSTCNHKWVEHKKKMFYHACGCGAVFWAETANETLDIWNMHVYENIDNYADHCGGSNGSEKYTDYKTCTLCGKKVNYEMPDKYK